MPGEQVSDQNQDFDPNATNPYVEQDQQAEIPDPDSIYIPEDVTGNYLPQTWKTVHPELYASESEDGGEDTGKDSAGQSAPEQEIPDPDSIYVPENPPANYLPQTWRTVHPELYAKASENSVENAPEGTDGQPAETLTPAEKRHQEILNANFDDIDIALDASNEDAVATARRRSEANPDQTDSYYDTAFDKLDELSDARKAMEDWSTHVQESGEEINFPDYVKSRLDAMAEDDSDSEAINAADNWINSGKFYKYVRQLYNERDAESAARGSEANAPESGESGEATEQPFDGSAETVESSSESQQETANTNSGESTEDDEPVADEMPQAEINPSEHADTARENVERARNAEVVDNVVEFAKGGTFLESDGEFGFADRGDVKGSYSEQLRYLPRKVAELDKNSEDWRDTASEALSFTQVRERDTRQVTKERTVKGRLGRKSTEQYTETEEIPNSEHDKTIINENGEKESLVRFRYKFDQRSLPAHMAEAKGELPAYSEFTGGRSGAEVIVGLDLPKSMADKLQAHIEDNPANARKLVDKLFQKNNNGSLSEKDYNEGSDRHHHPIRPPYDHLPDDWNIKLVTNSELERKQPGSNILLRPEDKNDGQVQKLSVPKDYYKKK
jgi:hypothetical protein